MNFWSRAERLETSQISIDLQSLHIYNRYSSLVALIKFTPTRSRSIDNLFKDHPRKSLKEFLLNHPNQKESFFLEKNIEIDLLKIQNPSFGISEILGSLAFSHFVTPSPPDDMENPTDFHHQFKVTIGIC